MTTPTIWLVNTVEVDIRPSGDTKPAFSLHWKVLHLVHGPSDDLGVSQQPILGSECQEEKMTDENPVNDRIRNEFVAKHDRFSLDTFPHVVPVGKNLMDKGSGIDFYTTAAWINANVSGKWSVNVSFPSDFGLGLWNFSFEQDDDASAFRATLPTVH